jgi:hypothetical protein
MLAVGACALENSRDAAQAYPDLVPSDDAIKQDRMRRSVTFPYREIPIRKSHSPLIRVTYKRQGAGRREATAMFLRGCVEDRRGWLEARLGPLASFEI